MATIRLNGIKERQLFYLKKDPRELNNVYTNPKYADTVNKFNGGMTQLRHELDNHDRVQNVQRESLRLRLVYSNVCTRSHRNCALIAAARTDSPRGGSCCVSVILRSVLRILSNCLASVKSEYSVQQHELGVGL